MAKTYEDILVEQHALNEQRTTAVDRGDHEVLDQLQSELNKEKEAVLGHRVGEVVVNHDGVVVDKQVLDAEAAAGHDESGPYNGHQR